MAKRKRRKKKNSHFLRTLLLMALAAFVVVACIRQGANSTELTAQAEKVLEKAQVAVEQTLEGVSQIQQRIAAQQSSGNTSTTTVAGIEMPAKRLADTRIITRTGYTLSYNDTWRMPNWVAWELTPEEVNGREKRTDFFETDPNLPARVRSEYRDYSGSRYDRGHMAPAGDMKWDGQAMIESFYMSNICPQAPGLNKGSWRILEEQCRKWAQRHHTPIYIVCGPLVDKEKQHKHIGRNRVTVPDAFFKVVLKLGKRPTAAGFIFPNDDCNAPLADYAIPVDSVEKITGIDFFHQLPDEQENALEATNGMRFF